MAIYQTYYNYIGGEWCASSSGRVFPSINPAHKNQTLGYFQASSEAEVRAAVDAAEEAFPKWSETPPPVRGEILLKIALMLEERKEDLARIMTMEMGKILTEARGDVQEAIDTFKYMAGEGRRLFGHTTTSELRDKFAMTVRRPVGVVAVITPWNFPIAIPGWKMAAALAAGNTVVWKPASDTPLCAIELVKVMVEAGIPAGVVNLVTGSGAEVGLPLVRDRKVGAVSFTGSRDNGEEILKQAGLKRVGLELGGKNPIIIMDDANLQLAVDGCIWGGFGTSGQRCTAASRVIVHKAVYENFIRSFKERAARLRVGDGLDSTVDMGPVINENQLKKIHSYTEIGVSEGAKLSLGGRILSGGVYDEGFFYQPTIFENVTSEMRIAQDEIFGPVVSVIKVDNLEEAIEVANNTRYGLSSSIYTNDIRTAFKAIARLEAGITYVNAPTIGAESHLPFGGVKETGNGVREGGIHGIEEFTDVKTVYIDYSGRLQRAQIDTSYG